MEKKTNLLKSAESLHWYHWLIVASSLVLTFSAWYITSEQATKKMEDQFKFQSNQLIQLLEERMIKYEEALWAGVATLKVLPQDATRSDWKGFSESLKIDQRFPGINGIGVIHYQTEASLPAYLAKQRELMPDYRIHPQHSKNEFWPITYIEPQSTNANAVGLDMAHETNRYTAAVKARDTGTAQITAPITLVQDAAKTPGFLFYAPWYSKGTEPTTTQERQERHIGLVYAPFIMNKLMDGALHNTQRQINFSVHDEQDELYNELNANNPNFDTQPLFFKERTIDVYGRPWRFTIQTSSLFRDQFKSAEPTVILISGLIIDSMLFTLFILLVRSNKRAVQYADEVTEVLKRQKIELEENNERLESANSELNRFAYIASHDLKEPLRTLQTFTKHLMKDVQTERYDRLEEDVDHIQSASKRMANLVTSLLRLSQAGNSELKVESIPSTNIVESVKSSLVSLVEESGGELVVDEDQLYFAGDETLLVQAVQNLTTNALKFCPPEGKPQVELCIKNSDRSGFGEIHVIDKGIGIEPEFQNTIFDAFKRLHSDAEYEGTGIGLSIVKKIVDRHQGDIEVESKPGEGTHFKLLLPLSKAS